MTRRFAAMILAVLVVTFALTGATSAAEPAGSPLGDADAVWHFDHANDAAGRHALTARGAVTLGVPLAGEERAASLARGGDGRVARFDGGYLEVGGPAFNPAGAVFTVLLRVRDPSGLWNAPLWGSYGGDRRASLYLRGVDGATMPQRDRNYGGGEMATPAAWMFGTPGGPRAIAGSRGVVEFVWGEKDGVATLPPRQHMLPQIRPEEDVPPLLADARNGVQRVMFPMMPTGAEAWHDVVVRGTGAKLELWIDGVLLDEEYPIGATRPAAVPWLFGAAQQADGKRVSGFRGLMDHAAVWRRALAPREIVALCGGVESAQRREREILGPAPTQMQYYRARGHNSKAGDCFPLYHDGTFHLFYLILRRNMHSKWDGGHGGLEIHHASTRDLLQWSHHPVSAPISQQWEAWNGTGNVVHHSGRFWMFYPCPDYGGPHGGIQLATSDDGQQFVQRPPHPFLPGGDCEVFADPDPHKKLFHLLKMGKTLGEGLPEVNDKTLVAWVSPENLDQRGAGVLSVETDGGRFDSLVLGEASPRRWMAGSDNFQRTQHDQRAYPEETAPYGRWVQIAATYAGNTVTLYRNGVRYASYTIKEPLRLKPGGRVLVGLRHLDRRDDPAAHFCGLVADARVYNIALSATQVAALRPHEPIGPKPMVWFDFGRGDTSDRAGTLSAAQIEGNAAVRGGNLVLGGETDCLVSGGRSVTLAHWVSEDLEHWRELSEPFITTDESLVPQMCPHWFRWNDWHYFIGGVGGIWKSRKPFGPWTMQSPRRLDNLSVPKTGAMTGNRRIFAGFLGDGGWGGNLVLREMVQQGDGTLGTRFVPEMIPVAGSPIPVSMQVAPSDGKRDNDLAMLFAGPGRRQLLFDNIPNDVRIQLTLAPQGTISAYGLQLRTTDGRRDGVEFRLVPGAGRATYSHNTHSGSAAPLAGGPSIDGLRGLQDTVRLDVVCRHDIVDVEVNGRHTLVNRFWNPKGNRLGVWVEGGALLVCKVSIRPLLEHVPPGALRGPQR